MTFPYQELLSLKFDIVAIAASGAALVFAVLILSLLLPRLLRVTRRIRRDNAIASGTVEAEATFRPVTVIVTSSHEATNLRTLLPQILEQDYPAPMEVIVVDDDDDEGVTPGVVSQLQDAYSNLYMTYAPATSRNLSRKKLAITLGVKAARYDWLVFTNGNCRVESPLWLRLMALGFARGNKVVLGYSIPRPSDDAVEKGGRRRRAFDAVRTAAQWLGAAIGGRPYRGDGNNLGYTRQLFMEQRGFEKSLTLVNGDDDIFVSQLASVAPADVMVARDAMVVDLERHPEKAARDEYDARRFTGRYLRRSTSLMWGFMSLLWWLWLAATVVAVATGLPSLVPAAAMLLVMIGLWIPVMVTWRRLSRLLDAAPLFWTVVPLTLIHPVLTLFRRFRRSDVKNYTWQ